jgi:hypothetical protein
MTKFMLVLSLILLSSIVGVFVFPQFTQRSDSARAADIMLVNIPAVVHGFQKSSQLPDGDLYLLPNPMQLAISAAPEGAELFTPNVNTFGADPVTFGALQNTTPQGLCLSTPGEKVTAVTCAESIWDGNLVIAGTSGTVGDKVRLFLQTTDGKPGPEVALFTLAPHGVMVTKLHKDIMLFVDNRYATGPAVPQGGFIAYSAAAGESGQRTGLLTLAWPMMKMSELEGCFRFGVEIERAETFGMTSVVVTDIVVNRNAVPGDENLKGVGLLRSVLSGFPTGIPCKPECPFSAQEPPLPPQPNPGGGQGGECNTICYRSPQYFKLNIDSLPRGTVIIGGVNYNRPISTTDKRKIELALRGGFTPLQQLNQEFVAAQLNLLNAGGDGSPRVFYVLEGPLTCYNLNFDPITLSNGFVLSPDSLLKDVYREARQSIFSNNVQDQIAMTKILDLLNGNNPQNICHRN